MEVILRIYELGEEFLFKKARSLTVEEILNPQRQKTIDYMIQTCIAYNGVGLAAEQVGIGEEEGMPEKIIVINSFPSIRYPKAPEFGPLVMINPEITILSEEKEMGWEGCLSIPGIRGKVCRFKKIKVNFIARTGVKKSMVATDFVARIIQHEVDHLKGRLCFLHNMEDIKDLATEKVYQKIVANERI